MGPTWKDVRSLVEEAKCDLDIFSVGESVRADLENMSGQVRKAILAEAGLSDGSGHHIIPDDTVLVGRSAELFEGLVKWRDDVLAS